MHAQDFVLFFYYGRQFLFKIKHQFFGYLNTFQMNGDDKGKMFTSALDSALLEHLLSLHFDVPEPNQDANENNRDDDNINRLRAVDTDDYKIIWLHSDETSKNNNRSWIETRLRMIFATAMIFYDSDSCVLFLESLPIENKLFFLGNGDDHERMKEVTKRFLICHIFWNRQPNHTTSSFIYLRNKFIEMRDNDDEKEDRAEKEKIQQTIDNYAIILLYQKSIDQPFNDIIDRLKTVFDRLVSFDDRQMCFDYIESSIDNNIPIYLILFHYNDTIIPTTNKTIKGIYCMHSITRPLSSQYFDTIEQLIVALRRDVRVLVNEFPFTMLQKSVRQLDPMRAPYTSLMGLLDVFISLTRNDDREIEKQDFLNNCRSMYANNSVTLQTIDRFAQEYQSFEQSIGWYTRDSFVYRLINQALRSQNSDIIHKYRFFINDLMHHLDILYEGEKCQPMLAQWLSVYGGQDMKLRELNKLKRHIGKDFALNSFYSATVDRDIGVQFAVISTNGSDILSVLVVLNIDRTLICTRAYASIEHLSAIPDEREVLIAMGSVFRLESVEFDESIQIWVIRMMLMEHNKDDVKKLIINPNTHEVSFITYQGKENSIDDDDSVHPLFAAAMQDTIMVHQYVKDNDNTMKTIQDETARLTNEMEDIFRIYGKRE
jgi:hypothetical protein